MVSKYTLHEPTGMKRFPLFVINDMVTLTVYNWQKLKVNYLENEIYSCEKYL